MKPAPVISVTIPTKNSARTLERCLTSVVAQDLPLEVIVADDCSRDDTLAIAARFGAQILAGPLPLLDARIKSARAAAAPFVVLLDSDQIVRTGVFKRCVEMFESLDVDALVLAEASCPPATWVSALFAADRRLLHHLSQHHMRPTSGSLLPRVFRKAVLLPAFELIPDDVPGIAVAQDHAIIWDAVARRARSVEIVSEAVLHEEMTTVRQLWRKYFSWGVSLPTLFDVAPEYGRLTRRAMRGRLHRGDAPFRDYVRSLALLSMKSMPYSAGFLYGRIQRSSAVHRRAPR